VSRHPMPCSIVRQPCRWVYRMKEYYPGSKYPSRRTSLLAIPILCISSASPYRMTKRTVTTRSSRSRTSNATYSPAPAAGQLRNRYAARRASSGTP